MTEYKDVMGPVAMPLVSLQGEASAYMGCLLPTLYMLKLRLWKLKTQGHLCHAVPLLEALLSGFEKRFSHLFHDQSLLMASATHPWFTVKIAAKLSPMDAEDIKERLIRELNKLCQIEEAEQQKPAASAAQAQNNASLFR